MLSLPLYWKNTLTCFYLYTMHVGDLSLESGQFFFLLWNLPSYHRYSRNLLWIMTSLEIIDLSQISMLFLKLSRKLQLYTCNTNLNQTNLMNLYNQPISDFIAAKLPSLAFTTTFCLKLIVVTALLPGLILAVPLQSGFRVCFIFKRNTFPPLP